MLFHFSCQNTKWICTQKYPKGYNISPKWITKNTTKLTKTYNKRFLHWHKLLINLSKIIKNLWKLNRNPFYGLTTEHPCIEQSIPARIVHYCFRNINAYHTLAFNDLIQKYKITSSSPTVRCWIARRVDGMRLQIKKITP